MLRNLMPVKINAELPDLRDIEFQVIVRSKSYQRSRELGFEVANYLSTMMPSQIPGHQLNLCIPLHEPHAYPQSPGGNVEVLVNMRANYVTL